MTRNFLIAGKTISWPTGRLPCESFEDYIARHELMEGEYDRQEKIAHPESWEGEQPEDEEEPD